MADWRAQEGREQFRHSLGITRARELAAEASEGSNGPYNAFTPLGDYLAATRWKQVPVVDRVLGLVLLACLIPFVLPPMIGSQLLATVGVRVNEYRHPFVSAFICGCCMSAILLPVGLLAGAPDVVDLALVMPLLATPVVGTIMWLDTRGYMPPPGAEPDSYWQIMLAALLTRGDHD